MEQSLSSKQMETKREIPPHVLRQCGNFKRWQMVWFLIHYVCGISSIVMGCFVTISITNSPNMASGIFDFVKTYTWLWGILVPIFTGIVTFMGPKQKGECYKRAFFNLALAIDRYQYRTISVETLFEELKNAQNIVLGADETVDKQNVPQKDKKLRATPSKG